MDITEPEGDFSIEWNDNSTYEPTVRMQRGVTNVTFNGTEMIAHPEEYEGSALQYNWTLIDEDADETLRDGITESNWTYEEFTDAGEYTIRLNLTDEPSEFTHEGEGNYRAIEKTIIIERGPVPDLMVHDLEFSEEEISVGDVVIISVNVTNIGDLEAEDIDTKLRVDGELVDIDERFYQDGEELDEKVIETGETVTVKMELETEDSGERTVNVNVTAAEEPEVLWIDNEIEDTIYVEEDEEEYGLLFEIEDEDGNAIEGATVEVDGMEETTDTNGEAVFDDLEPDTYEYEVTHEGYETEDGEVEIENEDETVTVTMEEDEEDDIPGFTSLMLMFGVIIAVAIYRKKKEQG